MSTTPPPKETLLYRLGTTMHRFSTSWGFPVLPDRSGSATPPLLEPDSTSVEGSTSSKLERGASTASLTQVDTTPPPSQMAPSTIPESPAREAAAIASEAASPFPQRAQPAPLDGNGFAHTFSYGSPYAGRGWREQALPDGTKYFVNPRVQALTDIDLRNLAKLEAVMSVVEMAGSALPKGCEMWVREGPAAKRGWRRQKVTGEPDISWIDHRIRRVLGEIPSADGIILSGEDDILDDEYRYWSFVETHPAHISLPPSARQEALDALHWSDTDPLLAHPQPIPPPFTQEECHKLSGHLNDPNLRSTTTHTRIIARILLRVAHWRQMHFRPHKPLPHDVPVMRRPIRRVPTGRTIVDISRAAAAMTSTSIKPSITLKGHEYSIKSISYFPHGQRMISGSGDRTTRQWDLKAGKEIEEARDVCEQVVLAVAVSRDGRWVVTGGGEFRSAELKASEVGTGIVKRFEGHSSWINCIDISMDSKLLASGSEDQTARIWSLDTGEFVAGPFQSVGSVGAIRFSTDSKKLAVMSSVRTYIEVWDVQSQKSDVQLNGPDFHVENAEFTSTPMFWTNKNKNILATFSSTGDCDGTIYEFDASTLETVGTPFEGHTMLVIDLELSCDHALLASASSDNTIKLWAFESRQLLASFDVQDLFRLVLSPDSRQLAYTTDHCKICVCDIPPDVLVQASVRIPTADLQNTALSPVIALPPPPRTPSPTVTSRLPPLRPDPRELLPSSSHIHTVSPARNVEPDNFSPEAMLQDLSKYVTKDGDYPVARGGFGEIWRSTLDIDRSSVKVAVKALQVYVDDQLQAAKRKKTKRIMRELRICANLNHRNILRIYGYTYGFGPFPAIVSPWAENGDLMVYLEREGAALNLVRRFQLLRDIIAGLHYLHANNVIHGDFNGPNVLIRGDGTACVADFGLSLMYSEAIGASQASWTSTLKGNMRWMAPELLVEREDGSQARPTKQSDMYSFGGIMLLVLTNKVPYHHLTNDAAIILCIAKSQMPSRSRYPELPEQYWSLIEKCWSTDPQDRPSTEGAKTTIRNEFYSLSGSH